MSRTRTFTRLGALALAAALLSGCNTLTRLSEIGEEPKLSAIENPTQKSGYQPVTIVITSYSIHYTKLYEIVV